MWCCSPPAGTFALTMGARQSMGLFVGTLNTTTGLGLAGVSLAFAFGQFWWGLTQPLAGIVADRIGAGRVLLARPAAGGARHRADPVHDDARSA